MAVTPGCGKNTKNQSLGLYSKIMEYNKRIIGKIQRALAVSKTGAKGFIKAVGWSVVQNLTNIFPIVLVFLMIQLITQNAGITQINVLIVVSLALGFVIVMYWAANQQYKSTFSAVYAESAHMRISVAEHLRMLPLSFFDHKNASDLTNRIMGDVALLENGYSHQIPQLFGAFTMTMLAMIGLIAMDWRLGLALTWVVPVALVLFIVTIKWQKREMVKSTKIQLAANEKIEEGFVQIQTIKAMGQEKRYMEELKNQLKLLEKSQMNMELFSGVIINAIQSIIRLALPSLAIVGGTLYLKGAVTSDVLLFFLLIATTIFAPLSTVLMNSSMWTFYTIRVDRMNEIYDTPRQEGKTEFKPKDYSLSFSHVGFSYEAGEQVLSDVTFTAEQGKTTALIGPSGGGKSTCAKLAARFWDTNEGSIKLGGLDISTLDPEILLQYYAIVFQDVTLFNATVSENIRFGRKEASEEEVRKAAELAQCDEFVQKLPKGYDTVIGENGSRLSGGERQRISIARAILKDAPIVIMDEATASQDAENETHIQKALATLIQGKTVLIIAHRMRTITNVDHIVVLQEGKVVEQGKPSELYDLNGYYAKMVCTQMGIK